MPLINDAKLVGYSPTQSELKTEKFARTALTQSHKSREHFRLEYFIHDYKAGVKKWLNSFQFSFPLIFYWAE